MSHATLYVQAHPIDTDLIELYRKTVSGLPWLVATIHVDALEELFHSHEDLTENDMIEIQIRRTRDACPAPWKPPYDA